MIRYEERRNRKLRLGTGEVCHLDVFYLLRNSIRATLDGWPDTHSSVALVGRTTGLSRRACPSPFCGQPSATRSKLPLATSRSARARAASSLPSGRLATIVPSHPSIWTAFRRSWYFTNCRTGDVPRPANTSIKSPSPAATISRCGYRRRIRFGNGRL